MGRFSFTPIYPLLESSLNNYTAAARLPDGTIQKYLVENASSPQHAREKVLGLFPVLPARPVIALVQPLPAN